MDKSIVKFSKTSISDLNKINAITSMTNAGNFTMNDNLSVAVTESDNGTYESNDEVINLQCTDTNVLCNPPEALSPVDFKLCFSIGLSVLVTACLFALLNNNCYLLPNLQETSEGKDNVYDFSLTKGIKICSHNVNRLEHKLDEIKYNLMFSENPPDIYCCCETFLDSNTQDNFIQIPGYKIEDLQIQRKFRVDLNLSICFESNEPCLYEIVLFKDDLVPKILCNWEANFSNPDFSLEKYVTDAGEEINTLTEPFIQKLMEDLGISSYLSDDPCNITTETTHQIIRDGNLECDQALSLPALPNTAVCILEDTCTAVKCCMDVWISEEVIFSLCRDRHLYKIEDIFTDQEYEINLNMSVCFESQKSCYFTMTVFSGYRLPKVFCDWEQDLIFQSEKMFMVDLSFHICMEEKDPNNCIVNLPILTNAKLAKPICNWNIGFLKSNFSLTTWKTENLIADTETLEEVIVAQLLYKLGINEYMKDPQCDRNQPPYQPANNMGWNLDKCNSSVDIPMSLPAGISCYLSDTCTGIDCCIQVDKLGLSVNAYVVLDACHNTFTVGVENYKHTTTMLDIDYGEIQTFSLMGFVRVSYKIHEFFHERMFVVSVNISVCYEANGPCALDLKILENTKLPIPLCDFNQEIPGEKIKDFPLAAWLDNNKIDLGQQLQSYYVDMLMEELGIAGYLLNPQCRVSAYQADTNRWNAGSCDTDLSLPTLPSNMACRIPDYCTGFCAVYSSCNADLSLPTLPSNMACQLPDYCTGIQCCLYIPLLDISVEFHVLIDICNLKLSIGLENLVINESLSDYNFNTQNNISLGNIIKLSSWLNDHDLLSDASELSDLMASKLLEDLGIAEYLQEPSCNPVTDTAFSNVQSNGWNSACPSVVLPDLPDDVVCHLDSTCTSVTCCAHVGLINRNIHFFLTVDPCNQTFTIDWSLSNWYKHTGFQANVTLTTDEISQLMLDLGLSKFLYDNKCDYTDSRICVHQCIPRMDIW
ncbi:unnamed protein product [Mytilus edulis]|uniref:Uncharacterized protein n=1 Tax=Mytilus edulis TaxID=6550 RepID=A0A8S3QPP3_MYTED|nr:unnamed protein product [Mytilus edulis]